MASIYRPSLLSPSNIAVDWNQDIVMSAQVNGLQVTAYNIKISQSAMIYTATASQTYNADDTFSLTDGVNYIVANDGSANIHVYVDGVEIADSDSGFRQSGAVGSLSDSITFKTTVNSGAYIEISIPDTLRYEYNSGALARPYYNKETLRHTIVKQTATDLDNSGVIVYKWVLTCYNGSESVESFEIPFIMRTIPTVTLTIPDIIGRRATFEGAYVQAENIPVRRWFMSWYSEHGELIEQSDWQSSSLISYEFDGFVNYTSYKIQLTVETQDNVLTSSSLYPVTVIYPMPTLGFTPQDISRDSIELKSNPTTGSIDLNWTNLRVSVSASVINIYEDSTSPAYIYISDFITEDNTALWLTEQHVGNNVAQSKIQYTPAVSPSFTGRFMYQPVVSILANGNFETDGGSGTAQGWSLSCSGATITASLSDIIYLFGSKSQYFKFANIPVGTDYGRINNTTAITQISNNDKVYASINYKNVPNANSNGRTLKLQLDLYDSGNNLLETIDGSSQNINDTSVSFNIYKEIFTINNGSVSYAKLKISVYKAGATDTEIEGYFDAATCLNLTRIHADSATTASIKMRFVERTNFDNSLIADITDDYRFGWGTDPDVLSDYVGALPAADKFFWTIAGRHYYSQPTVTQKLPMVNDSLSWFLVGLIQNKIYVMTGSPLATFTKMMTNNTIGGSYDSIIFINDLNSFTGSTDIVVGDTKFTCSYNGATNVFTVAGHNSAAIAGITSPCWLAVKSNGFYVIDTHEHTATVSW